MIRYRGRQYIQLREAADPQKDREYRVLAEEAYNKYVAFLKHLTEIDWDDIDWDVFGSFKGRKGEPFYSVDFGAIDPRYKSLQVNIGPYPDGNQGPGGSHHSGKILLKSQITIGAVPREDLIEVKYGHRQYKSTPEQLDILRRNVPKHVFVHEFIHYLDYLRKKKPREPKWEDVGTQQWEKDLLGIRKPRTPTPEERRTQYLSSPHEFNAWYQTSVRELEDYLDELAEFFPEDLDKHMRTKQRFIDKALELFSSKYLAKGQPFLWDVELLDDKYRRKLLKRLHGFYDYYMDKIEKRSHEIKAAGTWRTT